MYRRVGCARDSVRTDIGGPFPVYKEPIAQPPPAFNFKHEGHEEHEEELSHFARNVLPLLGTAQ